MEMEERHDNFIRAANACEHLNFNSAAGENMNMGKLSPSTSLSFDTRYMNWAWTVCYGTTFIILVFLLFLWYYFERQNAEQLGQ